MPLKKYLPAAIFLPLLALLGFFVPPLPAQGADSVVIWGGPPTVKQVALTFDDGPSPRYTEKISSLLHRYGAQGTFFVLGDHVERYPHVVKTVIQAGHEVGNHSFDHPRLTQSAESVRKQELERTGLNLRLLGYHPAHPLFRPPFSAYDDRLLAYLAQTNRRMVLWGIDSGDWQGLPAESIAHNVLDRVRPGAIIIFHDSDETGQADRRPTVGALNLILPALQAVGYGMVTISQLVAGTDPPKSAVVRTEPPKPVKPSPVLGGRMIKASSF